MRKLLHCMTDWVSTKRGMWITITVWLVLMVGLSAGPRLDDYKVTNFQSLPNDVQSIIAQNKTEAAFPNEQGTPGILVFHNSSGNININEVKQILNGLISENIPKSMIRLTRLATQSQKHSTAPRFI